MLCIYLAIQSYRPSRQIAKYLVVRSYLDQIGSSVTQCLLLGATTLTLTLPILGRQGPLSPSPSHQPKEFNKFYPCPLSFSFRLLPELDWLAECRAGCGAAARRARTLQLFCLKRAQLCQQERIKNQRIIKWVELDNAPRHFMIPGWRCLISSAAVKQTLN